jgi:hypothetical protein
VRSLLHETLVGQSEPVFMVGEHVVPAPSMWAAQRAWVTAWRDSGLVPGDRVVVASADTVTTIEVLLAALWEGIGAVVCAPDRAAWAATSLGARVVVADPALVEIDAGGHWWTDGLGRPVALSDVRPPAADSAGTAVMGLTDSGWVRFHERDLLGAVADPVLAGAHGARVVSTVSWTTAGGVIVDLVGAIARSASVLVHEPEVFAEPVAVAEFLDEAAWCTVDARRWPAWRADAVLSAGLRRCRGWALVNRDTARLASM